MRSLSRVLDELSSPQGRLLILISHYDILNKVALRPLALRRARGIDSAGAFSFTVQHMAISAYEPCIFMSIQAKGAESASFRGIHSVRSGETTMRFSLKAMAIAAGLLWGGAILFVGVINLISPSYGSNFIQLTSSVYPWFHDTRSIRNVVIGAVDGLLDGAAAGFLLAWLYNAFSHVQTHGGELHREA